MTMSPRRCMAIAFVLMLLGSGCVYRSATPPPPGPLDGVTAVAVSFDYSTLLVNGMGGAKSEAAWVAAKSAEEADYPKTWSDLKMQWEQHFMAGFARSSPVPVSLLVAGTPPPPTGAVLKVSVSEFQLGKYIPFATQRTSVRTMQTWFRGEQPVQSSGTEASFTPSITAPSVFQHIRPIGEQSGQQTAMTLMDRPGRRGGGGGGGVHIHVSHHHHRHHPRPFLPGVRRRHW